MEEVLPPPTPVLPAPTQTLYRIQPKGKELIGHTSGLAYEKVPGIFAFERPEQVFDTYTWLHIRRKGLKDYEMVEFLGKVVDRPANSEGVVVQPIQVLSRTPMTEWIKSHLS